MTSESKLDKLKNILDETFKTVESGNEYNLYELFDIMDKLLRDVNDLQDLCKKEIIANKKIENLNTLQDRHKLGIK